MRLLLVYHVASLAYLVHSIRLGNVSRLVEDRLIIFILGHFYVGYGFAYFCGTVAHILLVVLEILKGLVNQAFRVLKAIFHLLVDSVAAEVVLRLVRELH